MIATLSPPMSPQLTNIFRRTRRWLLPAALLALTPKCFLCLVGYAGLGTALGLGDPEICGASFDITWASALLFLLSGLSLGVIGLYLLRRRSR
ncbi:MAG: hypothetical protein QM715_13760 [Nibricoccus sp.]